MQSWKAGWGHSIVGEQGGWQLQPALPGPDDPPLQWPMIDTFTIPSLSNGDTNHLRINVSYLKPYQLSYWSPMTNQVCGPHGVWNRPPLP